MAIALVVGWAHLRVGFLLKFFVMILSILAVLIVFSQTPVVALYYQYQRELVYIDIYKSDITIVMIRVLDKTFVYILMQFSGLQAHRI